MFLGRYELGSCVPLAVTSINGSYTASWPTVVPTYAIYDGTGTRVFKGKLPPLDYSKLNGSFGIWLRLGSGYAVGCYVAVFDWTISGTNFREVNRFEVIGGGDTDGALVSLHYYRRPHADFLVGRLDSNQRLLARNPEE